VAGGTRLGDDETRKPAPPPQQVHDTHRLNWASVVVFKCKSGSKENENFAVNSKIHFTTLTTKYFISNPKPPEHKTRSLLQAISVIGF
jgi:hypothetical protein